MFLYTMYVEKRNMQISFIYVAMITISLVMGTKYYDNTMINLGP